MLGTLVPSHCDPAGHSRQIVRVVALVPPIVNEPAEQSSHSAALSVLYMLSAPHEVHSAAPAFDHLPAKHEEHTCAPPLAYVPAAQSIVLSVPSHEKPAGHATHTSELVEPGIQYVPGKHELHSA